MSYIYKASVRYVCSCVHSEFAVWTKFWNKNHKNSPLFPYATLHVFLDHPLSKTLIHNICSQTSWPLCVFEHGASVEISVWNFSHIDHKCMARCDLKMLVCENLFPQTLHTYGLAPVCFLMCIFKDFFSVNLPSHRLQAQGLIPVCLSMSL